MDSEKRPQRTQGRIVIVVTGSMRTGTSRVMQHLRENNVPVAGYAFHDDFPHIDLNPRGYWELPISETIDGLNTHEYDGVAVKLFGYQFYMTRPEYIEAVIVCVRDREDAVNSSMKLLSQYGVTDRRMAYLTYDNNYEFILARLDGLPHMWLRFEDDIELASDFIGRTVWQSQQQ